MNRRNGREHELRSWGGVRKGAGRKPTGVRALVAHATRPELVVRHPVHVTTRLRKGLPSLRRGWLRAVLESKFAAGCERFGFRLVHFSIQSNHLHLLAEACDARALSRGMQGLLVRIAKGLNKVWRRKGRVFSDRYHARHLHTPREVRAALLYVLHNARRHGMRIAGVDPFSSGVWFDGWADVAVEANATAAAVPAARARPTAVARSWLLRIGWRVHGRIGVSESPRGARARSE